MFERSAANRRSLSATLAAFLFLLSCGGGDGGPGVGDPTPASLTASGWEAFESGDWAGALAAFSEAVGLDPSYGEAHEGRGWSLARLDSLGASVAAFDAAITAGRDSAAPHAGKAAVLRDRVPADYTAATAAARAALARDGAFQFGHDPQFDWRDLRIIVAQSCFALTLYDEANAEVVALGGNPAEPGSETYVESLMEEIERLSGGADR